MPLESGSSRAVVSHNIRKEMDEGKSQKQAVAIALHKANDEHLGFEKLEHKLAHEKGVRDPKAVAAAIGMKKEGKAEFEAKAHAHDAAFSPRSMGLVPKREAAHDAEWSESDHPRSENGEFSSGGAARKSSSGREWEPTEKDLAWIRNHQERESARYKEATSKPFHYHAPEWKTVKGVEVKQVPGMEHIVAVPNSGRRNSANFDILDLEKGELLTQLKKAEVDPWLSKKAKSLDIPTNAVYEGVAPKRSK